MLRVRSVVALGLIAAVLVGAAGIPPALAQAVQVSVTPSTGTPDDTFTFSGAGFPPSATLTFQFKGPNETRYMLFNRGQPVTVSTDASGSWTAALQPELDLGNAPPGTWEAQFCPPGGECATVTFEINAPPPPAE